MVKSTKGDENCTEVKVKNAKVIRILGNTKTKKWENLGGRENIKKNLPDKIDKYLRIFGPQIYF